MQRLFFVVYASSSRKYKSLNNILSASTYSSLSLSIVYKNGVTNKGIITVISCADVNHDVMIDQTTRTFHHLWVSVKESNQIDWTGLKSHKNWQLTYNFQAAQSHDKSLIRNIYRAEMSVLMYQRFCDFGRSCSNILHICCSTVISFVSSATICFPNFECKQPLLLLDNLRSILQRRQSSNGRRSTGKWRGETRRWRRSCGSRKRSWKGSEQVRV